MAFSLITITDNTPIRGSQGRQLVSNDQFLNDEILDLRAGTPRYVRIALGQSAGAGGVFSWQNPESVAVVVLRVVVIVATAQSGQTIDIGRVSNAASSADTFIDGLSIAGAGEFDNITNKGTSGATLRKLNPPGGGLDWVTGTASGTPSTLAGFVYLEYILY